jgi:glycosyltransferase involved in cell wall biosynthesis
MTAGPDREKTKLMPRRQRPAAVTYHGLREAPDTAAITGQARADFAAAHPDLKLQPLVIVIAAYNEAENIGTVLDEVPLQIADVRVSLLVIDDGSTDDTTEVAERHGALVCTLRANRGHGVALRLGYRIAREGGAQYIATLDGDGQWDPADLPDMVRLLESGDTDFVIGSRQLGQTENTEALLRNTGVRFFARVVSWLTHTHLTDTSSGLRLMRAGLTGTVTQTQPQYQTSELLIGALLQGYRVAEVPTVMRRRLSGTSRKGHNVAYGLRYARVIAETYVRERRAARRMPGVRPTIDSESVARSGSNESPSPVRQQG